MALPRSSAGPRILMVGYNGANNTGAEALLLADIADVRAVLGPQARITIPSLNPANLRRYVREDEHLRIVRLPPVFVRTARRLVQDHDLVMLVEGSAYMDTWTSALLWAFLWVTHCAKTFGKPSLAYAVDAGSLKPANARRVRREASKTDLIITRSRGAAERLRGWGVTSAIEVTADNALTFVPDPSDAGVVRCLWPDAPARVVGMAVVDFHLWPVVIRPFGRRASCYRWPYYFQRSRARCRASRALAASYAALADELVSTHDVGIALIAMEGLDEPFAATVWKGMQHQERARLFSARTLNASQMTWLLRSLTALQTSRYHAAVLSLAGQVPQVAVGHDLRLRTLYEELGLRDRWFVEPERLDLLPARIGELLRSPAEQRGLLTAGHAELLARAQRNRELLRAFLADRGWV
ncbi:MAG: hypothetical protein BIP78_0259 [Candidatus Bipolaricaulis sibiricus]|uniref:Polysaccharide pyruvyl transferase domain-containing protein n=1 Tax=Bipolaricaulis sibiricus TaxID=2501609 RepID=A0A410FSJ1_BIPS1|nr:MAG: hypothetical protein BIP78_0259 [Candidatus Bipolaricaulis sibiricus]